MALGNICYALRPNHWHRVTVDGTVIGCGVAYYSNIDGCTILTIGNVTIADAGGNNLSFSGLDTGQVVKVEALVPTAVSMLTTPCCGYNTNYGMYYGVSIEDWLVSLTDAVNSLIEGNTPNSIPNVFVGAAPCMMAYAPGPVVAE